MKKSKKNFLIFVFETFLSTTLHKSKEISPSSSLNLMAAASHPQRQRNPLKSEKGKKSHDRRPSFGGLLALGHTQFLQCTRGAQKADDAAVQSRAKLAASRQAVSAAGLEIGAPRRPLDYRCKLLRGGGFARCRFSSSPSALSFPPFLFPRSLTL